MLRDSVCKMPGMSIADIYERMVLVEVEAKCRSWGLVKSLGVDGCWNGLRCRARQFVYSMYGLPVMACLPCSRVLNSNLRSPRRCSEWRPSCHQAVFQWEGLGWMVNAQFKWPQAVGKHLFLRNFQYVVPSVLHVAWGGVLALSTFG